ncbi:diacylglycerol/lipid kinase family protein [Periweissella fabalis]|uniref:DAGKc domain-containing protein n=1 Tax=Periweissella fabalis TaxID=1070421 RepID=A0A7X6S1V2_9LACO|nr:diacylglycerol kinase family protein [Periweissella fabalis]MCM0599020.1 hypothetical protein [Periweissella fabalis]NKZ23300.1 hypothetical protein [Periweissella fabalis]
MKETTTAPNFGIFYNDTAGSQIAANQAQTVKSRLMAVGYTCQLLSATSAKSARTLLKQHLEGFDGLVVVGGDGTLNTAMTAMFESGCFVPVGLIPSGRENLFAKRWQISKDVEKACQIIISGRLKKINVSVVNHQYVCHTTLTIGTDPSATYHELEQETPFRGWKQLLWWLKYLKKSPKLNLNYQFGSEDGQAIVTRIFKVNPYVITKGQKYRHSWQRNFTIRYLNSQPLMQMWAVSRMMLTHSLSNGISHKQAQTTLSISTQSDPEIVRVMLDGNLGPQLPLKMEIIRDMYEVFLPSGNFI